MLACIISLISSSFPTYHAACRYRYNEQPMTSLQCNPYALGSLIMTCEVLRGRSEEEIDIEWVFRAEDSQFSRLLSSTSNKFTINQNEFSLTIQRGQIRVDFLDDNDAGWYACQIRFPRNGTFASSSQALQLDRRDAFRERRFPTCLPFEGQSVMELTCALQETVSIGDGVGIGPSDIDPRLGGGGGGGSDDRDDGDGGIADSDSLVLWSIVGGVGLLIVIALVTIFAFFLFRCISRMRSNY